MISSLCKKPLTEFQEAFCLQYIKSGNASNAYRAVSPNSRRWTRNALWVTASKMMARPNVDLRISQLRATMATRAMTSTVELGDELDQVIELASRHKQCGVAVRAIMAKAKLFGFLDHKKETRTGLLDDLDYDQLKLLKGVIEAVIESSKHPADVETGENTH